MRGNMPVTPETVTIKVPATSANCGPGFDSIGIACSLYNTFTLTLTETAGVRLEAAGHGEGLLKPSERNFAVKAIRRVLRELGYYNVGIVIKMHNDIPMSRGLGSSSAAIVGAMTAANALLGNKLSKEDIFALATEEEGHPDNVAPAIYGGITVSIMENGRPYCINIAPPEDLQMIALVPDFPLSTRQAREALPRSLDFKDAVFNVGRVAFFVAAMCQNDMSFMDMALSDKLHQPYRSKFIPGMNKVFAAAKASDAIGCFISGSGSTLMAFARKNADGDSIGQAMKDELVKIGKDGVYYLLDFDTIGAHVI